jgi:hypothetical protein
MPSTELLQEGRFREVTIVLKFFEMLLEVLEDLREKIILTLSRYHQKTQSQSFFSCFRFTSSAGLVLSYLKFHFILLTSKEAESALGADTGFQFATFD